MRVKIKDIGYVITGNTPSKNDTNLWNSSDIGFVKPDIIEENKVTYIDETIEYISEKARSKARIVPKDSIFITCIGSIGKIGIASKELSFNQQINALIPNDNMNNKYLAYALMSNKEKLKKIANAPVVPIINKTQFNAFEINISLDILEQVKIVDKLDKLNDIIDNKKDQIRLLDELIKSRFVEMFGNPLTNPYGLPIVLLSELSSLITKGASPSWQGFSYTDDASQTLFITSENVREGYLEITNPKYIEDGFNEKQKRSILQNGDFLVNIVGASIGRAAQFNLDCKANMNQAAALVRINDKRIRDKYLLTYLNSDKAQQMYNSMKSDTGRANLSLQDIGNLSILLPSIKDQILFEDFIEQIDKSKFVIQQSIDELQTLYNSLMQEYFG